MISNPRIKRISGYDLDEHLRQPHIGALKRFLTERGYASHTVYAYVDCVAHFSQWAEQTDLNFARIDEAVVAQFIDDHLSHCKCGWPTRTDRRSASPALGHLLLVLRTFGMTAPKAVSRTPVEEELRRFDEHMEHVLGLVPGTRRLTLGIVLQVAGRAISGSSDCIFVDHSRRCAPLLLQGDRTVPYAGKHGGFGRGVEGLFPFPRSDRRSGARVGRRSILPGKLAASLVAEGAGR